MGIFVRVYQININYSLLVDPAEYICYDDGCHLKKYATNACRRDLTPTSQLLSKVTIAIDKMHMAGHVDKWCKQNCDPHKFDDLDDVSRYTCMASS